MIPHRLGGLLNVSGSWLLRDGERGRERDGEVDTQRQREERGGGRMGKRGREGQTDRQTVRDREEGREREETEGKRQTDRGRERSVSSSAPTVLESAQHIL